jgi:hypothetical protein
MQTVLVLVGTTPPVHVAVVFQSPPPVPFEVTQVAEASAGTATNASVHASTNNSSR